MQLKDLGNLSNVLKNINSSNNIADSFNALEVSMQKCVLTSGKLSVVQLDAINSGTIWKTNIDGTMVSVSGLSKTELEAAISTTTLSASQTAATATTTGFGTALKGLWATMMANPLIAIGMAVTAISTAWNIYNQSIEKTRQASSDAAGALSETTSSINDYAEKYKKLHDELVKANTTEERQHEIKSDLLTLQQELNDKYGDEYGKLNLVTDAYNDQTDAILARNKAAAQNYLLENRKGIADATKQMEQDRTYTLGSTGNLSNDYAKEIYSIASKYSDQGIKLESLKNNGVDAYTIKFYGNAENAEKVIRNLSNEIQDLGQKYEDNNFINGFLDNSTSALKENQKILDKYDDIYNSALMSQIATDNELSEGYNKATNAVKAYNDALISGDESKILSTRNDLKEVKNSIDLTSDNWKRYGNVMTDIFDQANTGLYDFRDALSSNNDNIKEYAKSLKGLSKADLLSMANDGQDDNFDKIVKSADKYGLSINQVIDELIRLKYIQDDVSRSGESVFSPLSKQEVISNINSLSEGFESLDKIMKSISDKDNPFDYALLDDKKFKDNFNSLGETYTGFVERVSSSPKDIKASQSAFDELVTTWIDSSGVLNGLTDENANLATAMLQNMGVANAEEVVMSRLSIAQEHLAAQKAYTAEVSNDLANATASEIPGIIDEATQSDIAKVALAGLVLEKEYFNGNALDTSGDIQNILSLVGVIGTANTALQALNTLKAGGNVGGNIGGKEGYDALVRNAQQEVDEAIKAASEYKGKGSSANASYTGGTKTNKPSGSGSKKDKKETEKSIDWIDRQLKLLKDKRSELVNEISDTYSAFSTATHDQILELDKTLIDEYVNAVNQYQQEYDKAVSKISAQNKAKIENGSMSVDTLSGTELENVQSAMDAYDKLAGTQKEQSEAQKTHLDDIKSKYDAISKSIENENSKLKDSNSILEGQMEYYKSAGIVVDSSYYNRLIQNTSGLISNTRDTISNKRAELRDLLANGADTSSQEYLDLKSEIADAESNVYALKKAQEEYNNKLLQLPIENMSIIVSMYQDIGNAISNWGSEVEVSGKKLDADYYQSLISNGSTVINQLQKQSSLIKDVMDNYDVGSDNWNELYKQIQSVNSEMSSAIQNIRKFNEELLKMPLENIGNYSSELQKVADGLNKVQNEQNQVISAATGAIKNQIDLLNEQKDAVTEQKTAEIDALKEKLKLLEKSNEERRLQFDLEQRQYDLERAKNQNINHVIRNGESVYEADAKAISDAQQNLLDSQYNLEKYNLQEQIDKAQDSLDLYNDGLQEQVDALQKISDKWSEISEKITQAQNEAKADEILGAGWKDKVLSGNDALYNTFSGMYANTAEQLKKYQDQIDSTNNIQTLLEDYIASYKSGEMTYTEAVKGINDLLSQLNQKMSATDNLQNIFDYLGTVNDTAANADAILTGIQSGLKDTATELLKSLEQYNKNSGMISEYTSSWQQLTNNVTEMLKVLKEVRNNLEDSYDYERDRDKDRDNDNTRYGGGKDGSPGTPGKGEYVNSGPGVYADGIKNGLVGSSSDSEREKMIKYLSTNELKSGEVPIIAHEGEAILNHGQQDQFLKNFTNAANFVPILPDYSNILKNVKMVDKSSAPTIHFNGGITIEKCDTPDEFAKGIMDGKLALALGQRLGKR
jgi:chromosome segregation ATPase